MATQTINSGDTIGPGWYQRVNDFVNAGAGGGGGGTFVNGTNPGCPGTDVQITRYWPAAPVSTNYGLSCTTPEGWSGIAPACEACFNFEQCHMLYATSWTKSYCVTP